MRIDTGPHTGEPFQQERLQVSWSDHWRWCLEHGRFPAIFAPMGSGKTEQNSIARTLWDIGRNPETMIKIICNTDDNAEARVSTIREYVESSEEYHEVFPHVKPSKRRAWTSHTLFIQRRTMSKNPTVHAVGINSSVTGGRGTQMRFDDPVDLDNAILQPSMRAKIIQSYRTKHLTRLVPGGWRDFIGTPYHQEDLCHEIQKSKAWSILKQVLAEDMSCIESYRDGELIERIPLLSWFPKETYQERLADMGLREFNRAYRLQAYSDADLTFRHFTACKRYGVRWQDIVLPGWKYYAGVDLSSQSRPGTVAFVLAVNPTTKQRVPVEIAKLAGSGPELKTLLVQLHHRYHFEAICVENNAIQDAVIQWCQGSGEILPIVPFHTGKQKADPVLGLPGMDVEFQAGMWLVPMADVENHELGCLCPMCEWIRDMEQHPNVGTFDSGMAGWFAREASRQVVEESTYIGDGW